jgi:hypothetical protein
MRRIACGGGNSLNRFAIIALALAAVFVLAACNTAGSLPEGPVTPIVPPPGALATSSAQATRAQAPSEPTSTMPAPTLLTAGAPTGQAGIIGALVNGTSGAQTPGNLPVTLYALSPDGSALMYTRTTTTDAGGHFAFDQIDGSTPIMYGLQVQYLKVTYTSDALTFAHGGLTLTVPITVYEMTGDVSGVRVEQMHTFFDYSGPGSVMIGQLFIVSNSSDRAYLAADGTSLKFPLPKGATNVRFMDGELGGRYRATDDGFADTEAVIPGTGTTQILVSYDLAYDGTKLDLNWKMPYAIKSINVLIPEGNAKLTSAQLTRADVRPTQGGNMVNFVGSDIAAGQSVAIQLAGAISAVPAGESPVGSVTASPVLIVAAALLLVAVAIVAFVWLRQRQRAALMEQEAVDVEASQDELLDAIAALDDDFEAGQIQEADYRRQRAELKAELVELMKEK